MGTAAPGCPGERSSPVIAVCPILELIRQNFFTCKLDLAARHIYFPAELRSAGQPRAAVPTWFSPTPKHFYRRQLPHLQRDCKPHFVTFCTHERWILPETVRWIGVDSCLHENEKTIDLQIAVVMPDHVHLIFTPLSDEQEKEVYSLATIMNAIKGASAHRINKALNRHGKVWQAESFDHVVRSSASLDAKIGYLMENPVRRRLVNRWQEYLWI